MIISSQYHRDEAIVAAKQVAKDYDVLVSPEFEYDGGSYRIVLDGHHSLAAAQADGVDPVFVPATNGHDTMSWLSEGRVKEFLAYHHAGEGDWYDVATGLCVW